MFAYSQRISLKRHKRTYICALFAFTRVHICTVWMDGCIELAFKVVFLYLDGAPGDVKEKHLKQRLTLKPNSDVFLFYLHTDRTEC